MISRVAESCFWLNRYVERVEVLGAHARRQLAFQLDVDLPERRALAPADRGGDGQEADFLEADERGATSTTRRPCRTT